MGVLTIAFTTMTAMLLIDETSTNDLPGRISWKVVELMVEKCHPKDILTSAKLKAKLNVVSNKQDDNQNC